MELGPERPLRVQHDRQWVPWTPRPFWPASAARAPIPCSRLRDTSGMSSASRALEYRTNGRLRVAPTTTRAGPLARELPQTETRWSLRDRGDGPAPSRLTPTPTMRWQSGPGWARSASPPNASLSGAIARPGDVIRARRPRGKLLRHSMISSRGIATTRRAPHSLVYPSWAAISDRRFQGMIRITSGRASSRRSGP